MIMNYCKTIKRLSATTLMALLLSGCEEAVNTNVGTGKVSIGIKDAPIDGAMAVVVSFTGMELKTYNGETITRTFTTPRTIDLLTLQGTKTSLLLDGETVTGGQYDWLRLKVDLSASYLTNSSGRHNLTIPSGGESGLKVISGFTVPQNGSLALTIDFDLRKSILEPAQPGGAYKLKPVLRLVQNDKAGHIKGTVPNSRVNGSGCGTSAVYLFEGNNITADDLDGKQADPSDSSLVKLNSSSGNYEYELGFLKAGSYTLAFTCQANLDNPESDDTTVVFSGTTNVTVTAATTTYNFP